MIRYKYANCTACHYSHTGGGLLTPYGKVIANEFSTFSSSKKPRPKTWEHGLQTRLSHFRTRGRNPRNFPMQLDYLTAFKGKKASFEGVLAKTPKAQGAAEQPDFEDQFYVRKALATYSPNRKLHFQLGRDALDVGLGLVDHTLFVRNNNKRSVTDFFTIGRVVYYGRGYKLAPYVFFPSYQESYDETEKGLGIKAEKYFPSYRTVLTFSQLLGDTSGLTRQESALSFKTGFKNFIFLGQASFTHRKLSPSGTKFDQNAYLLGAHLFPLDAVELRADVEKLFVSAPFTRRSVRSNLGLNWKPWRYLSLQYNAQRSIDRSDQLSSIYQIYFNGSFL